MSSEEEFKPNPDINRFGHMYEAKNFDNAFESPLEQDVMERMPEVLAHQNLPNMVQGDPRLWGGGDAPPADVDQYSFVPIVRHSFCTVKGEPCTEPQIDGDHYELPEEVTPHTDHYQHYDDSGKPPLSGSAGIGIVQHTADGSHLCAVAGIKTDGNNIVVTEIDIAQDGSPVSNFGWAETLIKAASVVGERLGATEIQVQGGDKHSANIYSDPEGFQDLVTSNNQGAREFDLPEEDTSEEYRQAKAKQFEDAHDKPAKRMGLTRDDKGNWTGAAGEPLYSGVAIYEIMVFLTVVAKMLDGTDGLVSPIQCVQKANEEIDETNKFLRYAIELIGDLPAFDEDTEDTVKKQIERILLESVASDLEALVQYFAKIKESNEMVALTGAVNSLPEEVRGIVRRL